jgi:hypothetical protein
MQFTTSWLFFSGQGNMELRGVSAKYVSLGPFTETKHNFMEIFIVTNFLEKQ